MTSPADVPAGAAQPDALTAEEVAGLLAYGYRGTPGWMPRLAASHELLRARLDVAEQDIELIARWLEDEVDAGLQIPLPVLAALAFSPAVLYDDARDAEARS